MGCSSCGTDAQIVYGLYSADGTAVKKLCEGCAAKELERLQKEK